MAFKFPFTNYHELNLTWVLDQLKKLFEESAENVSVIENYNDRLTVVETELPTVSETASEASRSASAAATLAQTAKATADTAQENAIQAQSLAGTARQEAQAAQQAADAATQAAHQAQATAQNFDGRITQAQNDAASALEASRSFENRVQAAITTANNAARTATDAQGVATNANQNAAAALDKIGNLSALETVNKTNLVAAINEVLATGGKVQSVNGKIGDVVLDADDIGFETGTVAEKLTELQTDVDNLDTKIKNIEIVDTKTGKPVVISDGADDLPFENITINFTPNQAGSGWPTPSNKRAINGFTGDTITRVSGAVSDDIEILWETDQGEIFGGKIVINKDGSVKLIADWTAKDFDGSADENWLSSSLQRCYIAVTPRPYYDRDSDAFIMGDILKNIAAGSLGSGTDYRCYVWNTSNIGIRINSATSLASLHAWLAENPVRLAYKMATPIEYNLSSVDMLYTMLGNNTINDTINTSAISVTYNADLKLYIDRKIAEIQALTLENNG